MTEPAVLVVRGEAVREAPPELARFAATVSVRDRDRAEALARLAGRSDAVRQLVDGYATAIERRETGNLWVRPERKRSGDRVTGYVASVSTTVTVTDFGVLGELMLRLADEDDTGVAGPWWELRPDSPVHREARRAAVAEAITRAREYAAALGAELTALRELSDVGAEGHRMMLAGAGAGYRGGGGVPDLDLDPEQQTVRAEVVARFSISPPRLEVVPDQAG